MVIGRYAMLLFLLSYTLYTNSMSIHRSGARSVPRSRRLLHRTTRRVQAFQDAPVRREDLEDLAGVTQTLRISKMSSFTRHNPFHHGPVSPSHLPVGAFLRGG